MPPSPSLRRSRSPARETYHKRANSFGSVLPAKQKDDELPLFSDMQKVERENFLLEPSEDFDDSIAKLSYFPEVKLGVSIPARGESHDLLDVDGDKNDCEWLLTPPETPLFRSLDDDDQSVTQFSRGRAQTKPIQISRSSTMDNTQRARSSASPSRLSPSPHSMARTRSSSSASRSSPPPSLQPPMLSRRSSTPPVAKTLTPPRRSPSPASRRMSTGSSVPALNGTRGASPVKPNRRSSSPKLQGWQSNVPGFPFDAPSNLRTSLPDRPVSRSRGGSPSSFSGLDKGSRGRRQSLSPTPSRRASSSHSIERDRMSSYSKASATSSGEDDLDSMQSVPNSYSSSPAVKKSLAVMKTRTIASSKNLSKNFTPSSVPKRSFDSAVWLMDHHKAPQDRFRPLLSGVPASTFGPGNGNNVHKPMFSHNSSFTTNSNASSDHAAIFGSYKHGNQEQHDLVGEWEAGDSSRGHEDIFMFDKLDEINEENIHSKSMKSTENSPVIVKHQVSDKQDFDMEESGTCDQSLCHSINSTLVGYGKTATCVRCGKFFDVMDVDGEGDYCEICASKVGNISQTIEEADQLDDKAANSRPCIVSDPPGAPDCIDHRKEVSLDHQLVNNEPHSDCLDQTLPFHSIETPQEMMLGQEGKIDAEHTKQHVGDFALGNSIDISFHQSSVTDCQQTEPTFVEHDLFRDQIDNHNHGLSQCSETISETVTSNNSHQLASVSPKIENTEATGISVLLLQKSNSNKSPAVEGRTLDSANTLWSEPYYARDGVNIMRRSFGRDSSSAASSSDLGSSRQSVIYFERLRSGKRGDFEKSQISSTMSRQSIASVSDMSISSSSASLCPQSDAVGDTYLPIDTLESCASRKVTPIEEYDSSGKGALSSAMECWSAAQAIVNDDSLVDLNTSSFVEVVEGDATIENHCTGRMADSDHFSSNMCLSDTEMPSDTQESSAPEESCIPENEEDTSAISQCNTNGAPEHPSDENNFDNMQMQSEAIQGSNEENRLDDCCMSAISEEDVLVSEQKTNIMKLHNDEESCEAVKRKRLEGETTTMETVEKDAVAKDSSPVRSASGITRNSDNMKPPKLESKCNCIIM
ncbi:hypothetical protein PVAP13_3KG072400 [Panicum virgatum]|uniref:Proline-rich family protein n=1 Tax=Panicum virgatum TaxID=38727 RepID=A0A8T0UTX2_PANVG|nr:hypothetical protein PVAP13_3KG072400 [Panicum virgatum]